MNVTKLLATTQTRSSKRCNHVAIVTKKGRVICVGTNSDRTHPLAKILKKKKQSETQCAELNAALKIGLSHKEGLPDFSKLTMTVMRIGNDGRLKMSRPCAGCCLLLTQCGFKRVLYSNHEGVFEEL